jgi:homocitrate synthase NifV
LADLGIPELEVGFPGMGGRAETHVRAIVELGLSSRTLAWGRATIRDLWAAASTGVDGYHFSLPASPTQRKLTGFSKTDVLRVMRSLAAEAERCFEYFSVGLQDASRAEVPFLLEVARAAEAVGARRVRVADTVGALHPVGTMHLLETLREATSLELEHHGHDDLGMAVANAVSAVMAGADAVSVTVNGLGERAGNAALEATAVALERSVGLPLGLELSGLARLSDQVARAAGRRVREDQPVVGAANFRHESGLHCRGLLIDRNSYELVHPEDVGRPREPFVAGAHSGSAGLREAAVQLGVDLTRRSARALLPEVRARAERLGRGLRPEELLALIDARELADGRALGRRLRPEDGLSAPGRRGRGPRIDGRQRPPDSPPPEEKDAP